MRPWSRLDIPVFLLLLGALLSGWVAWREAERARRTGQMLMKDYASFVADKFVRISATRYMTLVGISNPATGDGLPFNLLRAHANARQTGKAAKLPFPPRGIIDYFFSYDAAGGEFETSGAPPSDNERIRLLGTLGTLDLRCGPNQTIPLGRLGGARSKHQDEQSTSTPWSALIETDPRGFIRRVFGLRANERQSIENVFVPIITRTKECDCISGLLPASLAQVSDTRQAASFVLRDGTGGIVYSSEPQYDNTNAVGQALSSELPFAGWTVEVAMNPAVVWPLLPYGGRGASWFALSLLGLLVLGSGSLAIVLLRRETELSRLREDFISNVSHELRTPLSRIRLFNELLMGEKQTDPAKRSHYREVIERECRRLSFLVDNILDFARLERGVTTYENAVLDLRRIVEEAHETFRAQMDKGRSSISARLEEVPPVTGDARALEQVVINLLDNAVKYSPEGSPIELRLTSYDGVARLSVSDRGYGIPKQEHHRIFERFYRVESRHAQRPTGSGLGLSLVRRTVETHGGKVTVESEPGKGSTFVVEIPHTGGCSNGPASKANSVGGG